MEDIEEFGDLDDNDLNNCSVDERYELPQHTNQQIEHNEPKIGIKFNEIDELFEFYKNYAKSSGFPIKNLVDESRRLRLGKDDASAIIKYFSRMVVENPDGRSREAYKEFGEAVTFDTTYLTNKYDMPFAPLVGVNYHGQSILLGYGLISKEYTETFIWLFRKWLNAWMDVLHNRK
ncbi:protein FAR1-RELATED SEQUENCE 3-like [Asparagus officinalis]|uniref:protein FAR1-RELATED SEQUENCE 3-like n=1 Tax=Asparagus officinalis TaxID=4686 RepID=UPI00098E8406|nr:protein FAR1-RELATED SEQUENCE 3-like [Asparagus officinalis]